MKTCHITADNDHPCLRCGAPFTSLDHLPEPQSPVADLEDENADLRLVLGSASSELGRLRQAIEDFILWWDMPPFALDDDERLRAEVDALRAALATPKVTGK